MPEVLALLIPFAPFAMVCFIVWTKHKRKMTELQMNQQTHYVAEADAYARLEERIRVLERIVTDRGSDLASQIEALREEAPALQARRSAQLEQREVQP